MMFVTRRETFSAAHRLYNPELSDEENLKVFGKCSNPNWHGHNYTLEVVVSGEINRETGFVINLSILKDIIHKYVLSKVDHKNLNTETDFMEGLNPTSENIVLGIWRVLSDKIPEGNFILLNYMRLKTIFLSTEENKIGQH
jgi:6-pyruvoyltetrahydropterin/6-carboxytetrahydropterin synthase